MATVEEATDVHITSLWTFRELFVYAKPEYKNVTGSVKYRIAKRMIDDAEKSGVLKKGMGIIDVSSGNTGIGLSFVGRQLGYPTTIVTGFGVTDDSKSLIEKYGGTIIEVDGHNKQCYEKINELMDSSSGFYYWTHQDSNPSVLQSNIDLGNEIHDEMISNENMVDIFIASMGTGGTITGVGKALKERNSKTKVYLVLPDGEYKSHGVGSYMDTTVPLPLFNKGIVDSEIRIKEKDSIAAAKILHSYGFYVGVSSGAVFAAADRISKEERGNAVIILPDDGNRYTHLWV